MYYFYVLHTEYTADEYVIKLIYCLKNHTYSSKANLIRLQIITLVGNL